MRGSGGWWRQYRDVFLETLILQEDAGGRGNALCGANEEGATGRDARGKHTGEATTRASEQR
jgi:hypothetical protein